MISLGIDPRCEIVGVRQVADQILLRTRLEQRTMRYISSHGEDGEIRFFRTITSSERKRAGNNSLEPSPLEQLDWELVDQKWNTKFLGQCLTPLVPARLIAPTDYAIYILGDELVSQGKLKEIILNHADIT